MWEHVARLAERDAGKSGVLGALDSIQIVFCQTWEYDDAVARLARPHRRRPAASSLLRHRRHDHAAAGEQHVAKRCCGARWISRSSRAPRRWRRSGCARSRVSATRRRSRRRAIAVPVGVAARSDRGRARGVPGVAHVRAVRQCAARAQLGIGARRVPRRDRRDARADDADRGAQSARLVPRRAHARPRSSTRRPTTAWSATRTRSTWCR